jgi:hypothetical protein
VEIESVLLLSTGPHPPICPGQGADGGLSGPDTRSWRQISEGELDGVLCGNACRLLRVAAWPRSLVSDEGADRRSGENVGPE